MKLSDALSTLVEVLSDSVENLSVTPHEPGGLVNPPHAFVGLEAITPDTFVGPSATATFTVTVLVSKADRDQGWVELYDMLEDDVIGEAITESDLAAELVRYQAIGEYATVGQSFLSFEAIVQVLL